MQVAHFAGGRRAWERRAGGHNRWACASRSTVESTSAPERMRGLGNGQVGKSLNRRRRRREHRDLASRRVEKWLLLPRASRQEEAKLRDFKLNI